MESIRGIRIVAVCAVAALAGAASAQIAPPTCLPGTQVAFAATGAPQSYGVPAGVTELFVVADGAAGGTGSSGPGLGAHVEATVPVSGGMALTVIVGQRGVNGPTGGGGGGGSFLFTSTGDLLVAAGGGGGGGATQVGHDAELGPDGGAGDGPFGGAGGTGGSGGGAATFKSSDPGGGGGFLGAGEDGAGGIANGSGLGGHRVSPPGDAEGGDGDGGHGGFGGGGGGSEVGGGGGGGYSGGGTAIGPDADGGGGGGSEIAAAGTLFSSSVNGTPTDGTLTVCVTQRQVVVPTLSPFALAALAALLSLAGGWLLHRRREA
jgi:hypothetical protein